MLNIKGNNYYEAHAAHCCLRHVDNQIIITSNALECYARMEIHGYKPKRIWYAHKNTCGWWRFDSVLFRKVLKSFIHGNPIPIDKILRKYSKYMKH